MSNKHTTLPLLFALSASLAACDSHSDKRTYNDYTNFSTCYKDLHDQEYCKRFDTEGVSTHLNHDTNNTHDSMSTTSAALVAGAAAGAAGYYAGTKNAQRNQESSTAGGGGAASGGLKIKKSSSKQSGGWGTSFKSSSGG